jgi:hypothetical protein
LLSLGLVFPPDVHVRPIIISLKYGAGVIDLADMIDRMLEHHFNDPLIGPGLSLRRRFCEMDIRQTGDTHAEAGVCLP